MFREGLTSPQSMTRDDEHENGPMRRVQASATKPCRTLRG